MSLKQSVVIVNEFTTKTAKGGTRGGTPGEYVLRYMDRYDAVEGVTPIRYDREPFLSRYDVRNEIADSSTSIGEMKSKMRSLQYAGGTAFGYGEFSLSHKKLKSAAADIQKNFESGKTVMKTVLSFDEEYLRKTGLIDPDFHLEKAGDYRGNIDQLKLRMAIMNGMKRLSRYYDDMQYVGVIQVDTEHIHCHLAIVDRGNGAQRGKITEKEKQAIRRGIDMFLDQKQTVKMMTSNIDYDKRNTICFVKKYTHKAMRERGFSQFLLACLPEDRSKWRASSSDPEMRKPNSMVREYVMDLLEMPDSGYAEALRKVDEYARARTDREGLDNKEYRTLYRTGQERIIRESMNCVYQVLSEIPEEELNLRTPMLDAMSMDYTDMSREASSDDMVEFGFKLRSYKTRLDHHTKEMKKYHDAAKAYEQQEEENGVSEGSRALYDYFLVEEEYNSKLVSKYNHFLKFIPPSDKYQQGFERLNATSERIDRLTEMLRDTSIRRMKPDNAEHYGRRVYEEVGGSYMVTEPKVIENRLARLKDQFEDMQDDYRMELTAYGMRMKDGKVEPEPPDDFDDVKALDLHHLMYDFPYDIPVSLPNVDEFVKMADRRYEAFQKAKAYLIETEQEDTLQSFPETDIEAQHMTAAHFREDPYIHTQRNTGIRQHHDSRTVHIDYDFYVNQEEEVKTVIKNTINSLQYE